MKKMLMVTSVPSMIGLFNMDNILILKEFGYDVHVACDFRDRSVWSKEQIENLVQNLKELNIKCHQIDFSRSIFKWKRHKKASQELEELLTKHSFEFIHCHAPIASIITRFVAAKHKVKLIYTAHGFHFYKGAPIGNWLFYPLEKYFSKYTDILITINQEDYARATKKFRAKKVYKIPSVGLNTKRIFDCEVERSQKRKELGIPEDAFVLLSVGELSKRKNQDVIIRALSRIKEENVYYLLAGEGDRHSDYQAMIQKYQLTDNVRLLGRREDVIELCKMADVFVHPSMREGLGMAALEGMAAGLPLLSSNVNGINDYSIHGKTGYSYAPNDISGFAKGIIQLKNHPELRRKMGEYNKKAVLQFDAAITNKIMRSIYEEMEG